MAANAIDPKSAVPYEARSFVQQRIFDRLVRTDVLRAADAERWYIDLPAYVRYRKAMKKRIATIMGAAAAIGGAIAAIGIMN
ncbi:hypothetical protein FHS31_000399 [Sphingomonas vulcanisoli]|uniref:Uncharacterized protein n=1 Tax=Sphingomonas vulcanisoli TaxID=1658060 RepID=A0ABX0TMR8_9SPHN|nr:hypothetical protein [Sphingomonas vulcanisoli]NIJ06817.1 hypothetical protein [Sphingomonas vulcanisoli]